MNALTTRLFGKLRFLFCSTLTLLLLLSVAHTTLLGFYIHHTKSLVRNTTYVTRLRGLVPEVALHANILQLVPVGSPEYRQHVADLTRTIGQLEERHTSLLLSPQPNARFISFSDLRMLYAGHPAKQRVETFLYHAHRVLDGARKGRLNSVSGEYMNREEWTPQTAEAVEDWAASCNRLINRNNETIFWLNATFSLLYILTLVVLALTVLRPVFKRLNHDANRLEQTNLRLKQVIHEQLATKATLHESEMRFRSLADQVPVAIWLTDPSGATTYINRFLSTHTGVSLQDHLGAGWQAMVHPDDVHVCLTEIAQAQEQVTSGAEPQTFKFDYRVRHHSGEYRWFQATVLPRFNGQEAFVGMIGTAVEISDRKSYEEALEILNSKLVASNRELKLFTAIASHDLQEPIRKMLAFTDRLQALLDPSYPEDVRFYVARMEKAGRRLQSLVQALLRYAQVTAKPQPFTAVSLHQIIQDVLADLDQVIQAVRPSVTIQTNLPLIQGDSTQLYQLFQNLIGNALKYADPERPLEIRIEEMSLNDTDRLLLRSLHRMSDLSGGFVKLELHDNGVGFDQAHAERIFSPFQRAHANNTIEGVGMGLAICKKIVAYHQGVITASSQPGVGTTFTLLLPISSSPVKAAML
jgi:PAS domain S-box-containing protein